MKLLTNAETAKLLGIKPNTLEGWRTRGEGPRFRKLCKGKQAPIRYLEADVLAWLANSAFTSTSAYSPHGQASTKPGNCRSTGASV